MSNLRRSNNKRGVNKRNTRRNKNEPKNRKTEEEKNDKFLQRKIYEPLFNAGVNGPLKHVLSFCTPFSELLFRYRFVSKEFKRLIEKFVFNPSLCRFEEKHFQYLFSGRPVKKKKYDRHLHNPVKYLYVSEEIFLKCLEGGQIDVTTIFPGVYVVVKSERMMIRAGRRKYKARVPWSQYNDVEQRNMNVHDLCVKRNYINGFKKILEDERVTYDKTLESYGKKGKFITYVVDKFDEFQLGNSGVSVLMGEKTLKKTRRRLFQMPKVKGKNIMFWYIFKHFYKEHQVQEFNLLHKEYPFDPFDTYNMKLYADRIADILSTHMDLFFRVFSIPSAGKKLSKEITNQFIQKFFFRGRDYFHFSEEFEKFLTFCSDCIKKKKETILDLYEPYFSLLDACMYKNTSLEEIDKLITLYKEGKDFHFELPYFWARNIRKEVLELLSSRVGKMDMRSLGWLNKSRELVICKSFEKNCFHEISEEKKFDTMNDILKMYGEKIVARLVVEYPDPELSVDHLVKIYEYPIECRTEKRGQILLKVILKLLKFELPYHLFRKTVAICPDESIGLSILKSGKNGYSDINLCTLLSTCKGNGRTKIPKCFFAKKIKGFWNKQTFLRFMFGEMDHGNIPERVKWIKSSIGREKVLVKCDFEGCNRKLDVLEWKSIFRTSSPSGSNYPGWNSPLMNFNVYCLSHKTKLKH